MAMEIRVPTLGESVTEATVGQWFKKPGDVVAADEPLVELETDKVTLEVPAPAAGVLEKIEVKQGTVVGLGALLATINPNGKAAPAAAKPAAAPPAPAKAAAAVAPVAAPPAKANGAPASPAAAKIMVERGVEPASVTGTGKEGRITKADAQNAPAAPAAPVARAPAPAAPAPVRVPPSADQAAREERVPMTRLRQTIARRLKEAQNTAAMLTTFNEVDMSAIMKLRTEYRELFEKKHGVKLGFMGFFVKA
ncbi:MAG TPA: biotin/lipoyl-containing protein, partial [Bauldia sp.]|nr:biotin/lipoyl-containing protein [Bauldia sp.]